MAEEGFSRTLKILFALLVLLAFFVAILLLNKTMSSETSSILKTFSDLFKFS